MSGRFNVGTTHFWTVIKTLGDLRIEKSHELFEPNTRVPWTASIELGPRVRSARVTRPNMVVQVIISDGNMPVPVVESPFLAVSEACRANSRPDRLESMHQSSSSVGPRDSYLIRLLEICEYLCGFFDSVRVFVWVVDQLRPSAVKQWTLNGLQLVCGMLSGISWLVRTEAQDNTCLDLVIGCVLVDL